MNKYETVLMIRHDFSPSQIDDLTQKITQIIEENEGKIEKKENWGLRNLAYKIKKRKKAYYLLFQIQANNKAIAEYDRQISLNEDVLRHLILKIDEFDDQPSVMMSKPERDENSSSANASN